MKHDLTRRGNREYVFINFGDWRGRIVKVNIWNTGLEKLRQRPEPGWVGRWLSVTGLMDPPYTSKRYGYTHLSVTIEDASQLHLIDAGEAAYRLGQSDSRSTKAPPPTRRNRDLLETISSGNAPTTARGSAGRTSTGRHAGSAATPQTSNRAILQQIKTGSGSVSASSSPGSALKPSRPRENGVVGWVIGVVIVIGLLILLGHC